MTRRRALVLAAVALVLAAVALAVALRSGDGEGPDDGGRVRVAVDAPGPPGRMVSEERDAYVDECAGGAATADDTAHRRCRCVFDEYHGPDSTATEADFQRVFDGCYDRSVPPTSR